jgi:hypothetical protein
MARRCAAMVAIRHNHPASRRGLNVRKLLLALVILPFVGTTARAQNFFAVVTIVNQTQDRITYTLSWGGFGPRTVTLFPGQAEVHGWHDHTGIPLITYAPNVNGGGLATETLQAFIQPTPFGGKVYAFRQSPGDTNVFLVPLN